MSLRPFFATRRGWTLSLLATLACGIAPIAHAQALAWPALPIKLVSPWPAGGSNDTFSRLLATRLTTSLGQPVVVDNRPGATGTLGVSQVARAPADGYTLVMGSSPTHATAPSIYPQLSYNPIRDFAPVTLVGSSANVLVVHPSLPVRSVSELITLARSQPGKLSYASAGNGSSQHLSAELFNAMAGVQMLHVPYKGAAPAITDIVAGHVSLGFHNMVDVLPHVKAGTLRLIAVTSAKRSKALPDAPTIAESGVPGYQAEVWFGVFAPAQTPRPIVDRLHREFTQALAEPEVRGKFDAAGLEVVGSGPEAFARYLQEEVTKWSDIVRRADVKPN
ncbi:Bug family tripartite tricarboxylate transporter substrate binding protein [Hydrogenophaga sp. BPS33]|uniref:Bug family tripartite tricarboxylate transporter substrate binding protein n=1 Tax=Hydrogenophaga sp. BPS33 TaxID=2651974 RepID=UPI0013578252|nr:tripartite tricarboxylate transporter substrate binding protein [Hydrogenophaga sp. BPS33]